MSADGGTRNSEDIHDNENGQNNGNVQDNGRDNESKPAAPVSVPAGVLPNKAAEDDPRRWGDEPGGYDHDSWLQEQKPPHWG